LYRTLNISPETNFDFDKDNFELNDQELNLFRKVLDWPKVVDTASNKYEPHRIPFYLYELATIFHSYWSKGNENEKYKFLNDGKIKNKNTFLIIKLVEITILNGMKILGVSLPNKM
jgi:arginyl-tRNA synthetase